MAIARALVALSAIGLLVAGAASADDGAGDVDVGSSAIVSPTSNALVAIRRSEPRSEVALLVGGAVVDESRVSGLARAVLELQGSWAPSPRWELFATVNPATYRWVQLASPAGARTNSRLAFGSTTLGATWVPVSLPEGRLDGGVFVRALLPTSVEVQGTHAWGAQAGLTFRGVATRWLAWFGGASLRVTRAYGGLTATRTGASAAAGLAFIPTPWLRVVAQVSGNLPFEGGYETLSPGVGVRFVQGPFGAELGAVLPLGGPLRPFSTVARVSYRL
ncbi:MAG: hypothetical protein RJA59_1288 [Pseudomonadota bacterium]